MLLGPVGAARREPALAKDMAHEALVVASWLAYGLCSPVLTEGLVVALRHILAQWSRDVEAVVRCELDGGGSSLPLETQLAVYRVVQEAFKTVRGHAQNLNVHLCVGPGGVSGVGMTDLGASSNTRTI